MISTAETRRKISTITVSSLFFLSGATSLAYQIIWLRKFTTIWGSSTLAMAAVVSVFLGGLALGAHAVGSRTGRMSSPLKWYGVLELVIGAWALLVPMLLSWFSHSFVEYLGRLESDTVIQFIVRTLIAILFIGVPCLCMGGTLPLLVEFQSKRGGSIGQTTGLLYGINTLGGTIGCYLTGFHFLPMLGSFATNLTMVACNIAIGAVAIILARISGSNSDNYSNAISPSAPFDDSAENCNTSSQLPLLVLFASAITGFSALILEMVWARQLAATLGGSTYTHTATLYVLLLGLGIGGLLYRWLGRRVKTKKHLLDASIATILVICFATAFTEFLIPNLCVLSGGLRPFRDSEIGNGIVCSVIALIVELLPAIGMGFLFPALAQAATRGSTGPGAAIGALYLWNTMGAAVGAVLTFSIIVPLVGCVGAVAVAIAAYFCAAMLLEIDARSLTLGRLSFKLLFGAILLVMLANSYSPLATNMGQYLYGPDKNPQRHAKLLFFKEGSSCNVLVTEQSSGFRSLRVNGKVDASTGPDQKMQLGCAYFPRFLRRHARNVCVIGLGSGATAGASLLFPSASITCFELEPAVYEGARYFESINHAPWKSDRFNIVFDDARGALSKSEVAYDLIISEPSNPWIAGVSNLYTVEFYEAAKRRLSASGMLAQWVQTYNFSMSEFCLILRTIQRVFPHMALIRISEGDTILLACSQEVCPNSADLDIAQQLVDSSKDISTDLRKYFRTNDVRSLLLKHLVLGAEGLNRLKICDDHETINTDVNMRLEFDAPRQLFRQENLDHENVALAIGRALKADWCETCVDRWKCSEKQAGALADILETIIQFQGISEVQRMLALCRRVAPDERLFQIVERIYSRDLPPLVQKGMEISFSQEMLNRLERIGVIFWRKKQHDYGAKVFRELAAIKPQSATSWMNLAANYEALNQKDLADEAAQKAISIDPLNSLVQNMEMRFNKIKEDDHRTMNEDRKTGDSD